MVSVSNDVWYGSVSFTIFCMYFWIDLYVCQALEPEWKQCVNTKNKKTQSITVVCVCVCVCVWGGGVEDRTRTKIQQTHQKLNQLAILHNILLIAQ